MLSSTKLVSNSAKVLLVPALLTAGLVGVRMGTNDSAEAAPPAARDAVEHVDSSNGSSKPPAGAFGITRHGDRLEVTGSVPSAADKPIVLAAAKAKAGTATVVDRLTVDPAGGAPDLAQVSALAAVAAGGKGDASIRYDGKTVTGTGKSALGEAEVLFR
jgi:OmpA-OmpF porin, OOP family